MCWSPHGKGRLSLRIRGESKYVQIYPQVPYALSAGSCLFFSFRSFSVDEGFDDKYIYPRVP